MIAGSVHPIQTQLCIISPKYDLLFPYFLKAPKICPQFPGDSKIPTRIQDLPTLSAQ